MAFSDICCLPSKCLLKVPGQYERSKQLWPAYTNTELTFSLLLHLVIVAVSRSSEESMYTFIIHVPPNKLAQIFADKISRCFNIFDNFSEHSHALRIILCQFANKVHAYAITESFARMFVFIS